MFCRAHVFPPFHSGLDMKLHTLFFFFFSIFSLVIIGPHTVLSTEHLLSPFNILDPLYTVDSLRHFVKLMSKRKQVHTFNKLRFPAAVFPYRNKKISVGLDHTLTLAPSNRVRKIRDLHVCCLLLYDLQILWLKNTRLFLYIYLYQEEHFLYVIKGPKVEHQ